MQYRYIGKSGLRVNPVCMGTMTFGLQTKPRDSVILASKVAGAASGWFVPPIRYGLTAIDRFHIHEGSLKRLGVDYLDLYQMRWPDTVIPIEESIQNNFSLLSGRFFEYNNSKLPRQKAMAIAWSKQFDFVASTIVGAREVTELKVSLDAMEMTLSRDILDACDMVYQEILYPMG